MERLPFFIFSFTCLFFISKLSVAVDTISPTQTIRDGQTLVSASQIFELGFFSPGSSSKRYLGIWFKTVGSATVVWVANRNNPFTNTYGALTISRDGNIVLFNELETVLWSSNLSRITKNRVAQLLDSGNLVLRDGSSVNPESYLWQSFDYPCDTLLPGMKLGADLRSGQNWYLTSWKSEDDPSSGDYTFKFDYRGLPQIVLRKGSDVKFRSGTSDDGVRFGGSELYKNSVFSSSFVFTDQHVYYSFENYRRFTISRLVVDHNGFLQYMTWNDARLQWVVIVTLQKDTCDDYGICGTYGTCNINNSQVCNCLNGFTPRSPQDYNALDWSGGCVPRSPRKCGSGEGFRKFTEMKLPDTSSFNRDMGSIECEAACLNNCSCVAYAKTGIGSCAFWYGDLLDIREYSEGGQDLYIWIAASELDSNNKGKPVAVIVAISVVSGMLLCVLIGWNTYEVELFQAWKLWNEGKPLELIDDFMEDPVPESEASKCIQVGLLCVQKRPDDRPTMPTVLLMLDSESVVLHQPKQPGFYTERFPVETNSLSSIVKKSSTLNDVTVTILEGR
ncbi:hypothetical protein HHK36_023162 [Tetracentron sinense]|uniref:Uncharacterized protein n=1 Tax=Tetracentron sinense TaxID=13715 RepID=A0A834YQS7_TETSI|nr:hypothetical protein HHK36_023162 [Tetracentron sinense]